MKTGRVTTVKANIIEPEEDLDDDDEVKPLTADEFRKALEQLAALGLTFTADRIPQVVAKDQKSEEGFLSDDFERLQTAYPNLPRELSAVVYHALTGAPAPESVVGSSKEELEKKVRAARDLVITSSYRSEFFFKYSTKLPYFETIDWEVVFKTHERNVQTFPAVAYALLLLVFHNSNERNEHQKMTVAVDLKLVNKLIRILVDVKSALEDAQQFTNAVDERPKLKDEDDATKHTT